MADTSDKDRFFVGYAAMPAGLRTLMLLVAMFLVGAAGALAVTVATQQDDPGDGVWEVVPRTVTGLIDFVPYPVVHLPAEGTEPARTALLVSIGKFAAETQAQGFDGRTADVTGRLVMRGGQWLIELSPGDDAIRAAATDVSVAGLEPRDLGAVTLEGQIVDSKCFLGVMKPGEGKAHKACASLCIRGGIPPSFMVRHGGDDFSFHVVAGLAGEAVNMDVLDVVGDPVRVAGRLQKIGAITRLLIDPAAIERL